MEAEKTVKTMDVEVHSLRGNAALRLTAWGASPLQNGAVVKLPVEVGQALIQSQGANLKAKDPGKYGDEKPGFRYVVVSGKKPSPIATDKPMEKGSQVGKAANKNMAEKAVTHKAETKAEPKEK